MTTDLHTLLGDDADALLGHTAKAFPAENLTLPGPELPRHGLRRHRPLAQRAAQPRHGVQPRPPRRHRIPLHPPGRPGHRALRRGQLRQEPRLLRPAEPARARPRGRVQRRRHHARHARAWRPASTCTGSPSSCKLNHNEFLHVPEHLRPDHVRLRAARPSTSARSASAPPSTSAPTTSTASSSRCREAFAEAHELGMFTVLWCYLRNPAFTKDGVNYDTSADLTGQANHIGVTIEADIIKQKQPTNNGGYTAIGFGKTDPLVYDELTTDNPIDLTRWQVVNCYAGRIGLINSGRRVQGRQRPGPGRPHRRHQQARRRHGPHRRPQGLPAPDGRGRGAHPLRPGRLPRPRGDDRLSPWRGPPRRCRRDAVPEARLGGRHPATRVAGGPAGRD